MIWAAGVAASPLGRSLGAPLDRAGRVRVAPDLSVPGHPEIFVVGDLAAVRRRPGHRARREADGRGMPRRTSCIALKGEKTKPFRYRDYGQLATIGRNAAVAVIGKMKLSGFPAWLVWLVAHIYFLINFRNRLIVMIDWGWAYFTYQRYARIVIRRDSKAAAAEMDSSSPADLWRRARRAGAARRAGCVLRTLRRDRPRDSESMRWRSATIALAALAAAELWSRRTESRGARRASTGALAAAAFRCERR